MKDAFELTGYVRYKGENYRLDYEFGVEEPLQTIHQLRLKIWDDLEWAHQQRQNHRLGLPSSPA